jgi:hypothetical protein
MPGEMLTLEVDHRCSVSTYWAESVDAFGADCGVVPAAALQSVYVSSFTRSLDLWSSPVIAPLVVDVCHETHLDDL